MRAILAASAAIFIASSAPGMASDHAQCAGAVTNGDCTFTSHRPCGAVDGRHAACRSEPRLTYGWTYGPWRNAGEAHDYDFWHDRPYGWDHWR
jgi:hypothetical protein